MRCLILLLLLAFCTTAYAQAPPPSSPAPAPTSSAVAPGPAPTFHTIPLTLIQAACAQEEACGCSNGVDKCTNMFVKAGLPTATLACLANQPCDAFCQSDRAGQPGTKLHTACLTPAALKGAEIRFKENARVAACAAFRRCGCETRPPDECAADLSVKAPLVSGGFWACTANQPCADMCADGTDKPGGALHTRCMLPENEALAALTAQTTALIIRLSSQMQQRMHQTTMGIIRNMAPSRTRVDVYDGRGNYLRTE